MGSRMLERDIEKAVCAYARSQGLDTYKFVSPSHMGVPDRMFVGPGEHVFFIEFKREGQQPTPVQMREIAKLKRKNFRVYVVDNVELGKTVVNFELEFMNKC